MDLLVKSLASAPWIVFAIVIGIMWYITETAPGGPDGKV